MVEILDCFAGRW